MTSMIGVGKNTNGCPYFATSRQECLMTTGGLYIPMIQHINMLCTTDRYNRCHHYLQGWNATNRNVAGTWGIDQESSRRRYRRIKTQIPLRLITNEHHGYESEVLDDEAVVMDVSLGGIRLSTNTALPVRKTVSFQFVLNHDSKALPGDLVGCQGEVRWSKQMGTGTFQAGLLVTDKKTFDVFSHHIAASDLSLL